MREASAAVAVGGAGVEEAEHQVGELLLAPDLREPLLGVAGQAAAVVIVAVSLVQAAGEFDRVLMAMFMPLPPAGVIR
jgi:hypothetical protein